MRPADLLPSEIAEMESENDPLLDFSTQVEQAARALDLEDWIVQRCKHAEREITVNLPLRRDQGESVTCVGYRVQHCSVRGPCMGPVLLSPEVHPAQLRAMAAQISLQCALLGLPAGGSAGAVVCDPEQLSERELRRLLKDYVTALRDSLGPFKDVLAPDGNEFAIAWMQEALARAHGALEPAAVVGKPAPLGGIAPHASAAGSGVFVLVEQALAVKTRAVVGARVAIQGLGSLGASIAALLHKAGASIVAVADRSGGLHCGTGLDIDGLQAHLRQHRFILGYPDAEAVSNAEVLETGCDVLIAAAAQRQINLHNASRIRAGLFIEAVHGAITPAAEKILVSRGITVVPDILGTAAAPIGWFVEWQSGIHFAAPTAQEVEAAVRARLLEVWQSLRQEHERQKPSLREAANIVALRRLADGMRLL